ncbi:PAS domain-containing sensor histidine kinase [Paenibacillus sp. OV219]|uniref:PAS domain-containing sensor histidine kinase n=1 Tax=Paenibacillus sp. OV219 TaxID=1884377 RepID=UPI0008BD8D1B|nr:PAS domain-containing sensor histidine kinase [Paenibacillus sp. OV219]SEO66845.1 PAS/PAC sensor signal transduction histidine kinase [Paenibacillus sp. OV219]
MRNRPKRHQSNTALRIALSYVIIGSIWILLSDQIMEIFHISDVIRIHSTKGIFYVFITSFILYFWVKRAKKDLTESEERYRILVEHSPEPIAVYCGGAIVFINPAGAKVFGAAEPQQLIGRPIVQLVSYDYLLLSASQPGMSTEQVFQRIDGQAIDVEVTSVPIMYLGKPAMQLLCRDITERKRAERMLEENEQAVKSLVVHNPDAIFSLDLDARMLSANPAIVRITGYHQDELLHKSFCLIIFEEDKARAKEIFNQSLQGESNSIEIMIQHKDGTNVDVNLKMVPIIVGGQFVGVYGIVKDITKLKRTAELLLKSEKLSVVGQLAAGVAHEIRNPLTSLRGFVQLYSTKINQAYYQIMLSELDRINDIVSEFLVIAKPQAVVFEMNDIRKMMDDVISILETEATLRDVQIHAELASNIPLLYCQQNQLKQVFINVLKNAIEAMATGGEIIIQMEAREQQVAIRIKDNGCGIAEERLTSVGEPFYTTKEKGTGLGLMVCHQIMEAHEGCLRIESRVGLGTTVELILPLNNSAAA